MAALKSKWSSYKPCQREKKLLSTTVLLILPLEPLFLDSPTRQMTDCSLLIYFFAGNYAKYLLKITLSLVYCQWFDDSMLNCVPGCVGVNSCQECLKRNQTTEFDCRWCPATKKLVYQTTVMVL